MESSHNEGNPRNKTEGGTEPKEETEGKKASLFLMNKTINLSWTEEKMKGMN